MELGAAGAGHDVGHGEAVDAARRQDLDAAVGVLDEPADARGAVVGRGFLAGRHHAPEAEVDERVEGLERIRGDVERPVEDGRGIAATADEVGAPVAVDAAVRMQAAENEPVGTVVAHELQVARQHGQVARAVAEPARTRAQHHHHRNGDGGFHFEERAERGRQPAHFERGVQFEPVGAGLGGEHGVVGGGDADFEKHEGNRQIKAGQAVRVFGNALCRAAASSERLFTPSRTAARTPRRRARGRGSSRTRSP